ncbi:hypothetical protein DL771_009320 [Monosporascus sp. 5C6A]|nr:hypothetical protein DL771_009320 [Monosporascus sp. 5C6A]
MCPGPNRIRLPTRVINVSSNPPRLLITRSEGITHGRYAALSYCWGGPQHVRTTQETISAYTDSIPMDGLPRTLQDGIIATRGLGLKYLWIDALCIIQEDEEDYRRELPHMAEIYNSAYVTISASTAATCRDGFLQPRQLKYKPIRLSARCPSGDRGSVLLMHDHLEAAQELDAIHKRGWTLQEHLLAPRLLLFGPVRMEFICLTRTHYDGGTPVPLGAPRPGLLGVGKSTLFAAQYGGFVREGTKKGFIQSLLYRTHLMDLALRMTGEAGEFNQLLVIHWGEIIAAYTARALGVPSDRLKAIAGIAKKMHRQELGRYLAGLYSTNLHVQLLWVRSEEQPLQRRPTGDYRAPSWSWAAIDGSVSLKIDPFNFQNFEKSIAIPRILQCEATPVSESDKYSSFASGILRIFGKTKSTTIQVDPQSRNLLLPAAYEGLSIIEDAITTSQDQVAEICFLIILEDQRSPLAVRLEGVVLYKVADDNYQRIGYFSGDGEPPRGSNTSWVEKEVSII